MKRSPVKVIALFFALTSTTHYCPFRFINTRQPTPFPFLPFLNYPEFFAYSHALLPRNSEPTANFLKLSHGIASKFSRKFHRIVVR